MRARAEGVPGSHLLLLLVDAVGAANEDVSGAEVARDGEADSLLGDGNGAGVSEDLEVTDDALELGGGHADGGLVLGLRDAEVVGVNVHELELKVRDAVLVLIQESVVCS